MTSLRAVAIVAVIAGLLIGCSTDPETAKREYLASGDRYAAEGKDAEAILQYQNALQQDAKFGEARFKLAETFERLGNVQGAGREYIRAADLLPDRTDVQLKAASFLLLSRQFEDAKTRAAKVLAREPKNAKAHIIVGSALAGLKDFGEAIKELEAANQLEPSAAASTQIGFIRLAEGARAEAERAFKTAVENDPKNITAHLALANYYMATDQAANAESALKDARALDPGNALANRGLVAFYLGARRWSEAEPYAKALAEQDASPPAPFKFALADYYVVTRRPADAVKVLEALQAKPGSFAGAQTRLAVLNYTESPARGHALIDEVLAREPKHVPALLAKARFLVNERKFDDALARVEAARSADPRSIEANYLAGIVLEQLNRRNDAISAFNEVLKLNPRAVSAQLHLSRLNMAGGQRDAGLRLAESAGNAAPNDPSVQLALARSLVRKGEVSRAEPIVKRLVTQLPNAPFAHSMAGTLALAKQDRVGARRSYDRALTLDPINIEAATGLTGLDLAENNGAAARTRVAALLATNPSSVPFRLLAARTYGSLREFDQAEQLLRAVVQEHPNNLEAYNTLAHIYMAQQKLNQARAELDRIAAKDPSAVGARTMAGMILYGQGNSSEARRRFEEVLQIDPRAAVASNNLAYIYADEGGNLDVALQLAQTAYEQLPEMHEISDTLGFVYLKKELGTLALPPLQASVDKDPKNPIYHYHLGLAQAQTGEKAAARRSLERALSLNPSFTGAETARKALESLRL